MKAMDVSYFRSGAEFRKWLQKHHATAKEVWIGFYRKDSGKQGISYSEALDQALCFGWIDGVRKKATTRVIPIASRRARAAASGAWSTCAVSAS